MASIPPLQRSASKQTSANVRMFATIGGLFVPAMSIKVEQTAYGIADSLTVTTPLSLSASVDHAARSQQMNPYPIIISLAFIGPNAPTNYMVLCKGLVDEIESDYDNDIITFHGRGLLANLIDARVSVKPNMNSTVTNVITQLVQRYSSFTPQVASTSTLAGSVLKTDYIAMTRNLRALDFISLLARSQGWTVRVVNSVIVVGPPPDPTSSNTLVKSWRDGDLMSLTTTHNALHNRNIKVKIVSYLQGSKAKTKASAAPGPFTKLLGIPVPTASTAKTGARGGTVTGINSVGERDNVEEYVIPVPAGLSQQACNDLALVKANDINKHEFVAKIKFLPKIDDYAQLVQNSPDFNIRLTGCDQPSNDGLYFMQHVDWDFDISSSSGLTLDCEMINHVIPAPSGGTANSTIDSSGTVTPT